MHSPPRPAPSAPQAWLAYFKKWQGERGSQPARAPTAHIALAWLGGAVTLGCLGWLTAQTGTPLVLGSFGASCVLVFGFPDVPFSQPRNVLLGHCLSSLTGLAFLTALGPSWPALGLATGTAIALMLATRTVHPPAGSNPVIVFLGHPNWSFLLLPTALGAAVLILLALIYNNLTRPARYPKYWW